MDNQLQFTASNRKPIWLTIVITIFVVILVIGLGLYYLKSSDYIEKKMCVMRMTDKKINVVDDLKASDLLKEIFPSSYPDRDRSFSEIVSSSEGNYISGDINHINRFNNVAWNGEYWLIQKPESVFSLEKPITSENMGMYRYDGNRLKNINGEKLFKEFFWNGEYWLLDGGFKYNGEKVEKIDIIADAVKRIISADYNGDYWLLGTEDRELYRYNDEDDTIVNLSKQFETDSKLPVSFIVSFGKNWLVSGFYCGSSGDCFGGYKYDGKKLEKIYSNDNNIWVTNFGNDKALVANQYSTLWSISDCEVVELHKSFENQYVDMTSCSDEYCLILTRSNENEHKNLYKFDGEELKLLNDLFDQKDIDDFSYIYIGDNNWIIEKGTNAYAYRGGSLSDISVNLGSKNINNAVWNGEYWMITASSAKVIKYVPGFSDADIENNNIVKGSSEKIYLIEEGKKRRILNEYVLNEKGYNWSDVIVISDSDLESYPDGDTVIFKNGSIINFSEEVYIIENGRKRRIEGGLYGRVFEYSGIDPEKMLAVQSEELILIPDGISYSDYKINDNVICSKNARKDFEEYSWSNELPASLAFNMMSDICYNLARNQVIYFTKEEETENEPGIYKSVRISSIMSLDTLTLQTDQLLRREVGGSETGEFSRCDLTEWQDNKIEYFCGSDWYGSEYYLFDLETRINTIKNN